MEGGCPPFFSYQAGSKRFTGEWFVSIGRIGLSRGKAKKKQRDDEKEGWVAGLKPGAYMSGKRAEAGGAVCGG
jgi:hypothetical protein